MYVTKGFYNGPLRWHGTSQLLIRHSHRAGVSAYSRAPSDSCRLVEHAPEGQIEHRVYDEPCAQRQC